MKKKITLLVVLVLVVAFALTGCNMIKLNTERDDALIVAKISYKDGLTETVTKKELKQIFNTQGYYLIAYQGFSVQKAYDYCADMLAQQKLNKLMALKALCDEKGLVAKNIKVADHAALKAGTDSTIQNVFSNLFVDEQLNILKSYNEQMNDLLDNYVKEVEKEIALQQQQEEEEEEKPDEDKDEITEKPEIRATRAKAPEKEDEVKPDSKYSSEVISEKKAEIKSTKRFEIKWEEDKTTHTPNQIEAKKRLDKQLDKVGKTYDDLFEDIVNSVLVNHYRLVVIGETATEDIDSIYDVKKAEIKKANVDAFTINGNTEFVESKYKAAITGGSPVLYNPIYASEEAAKKDGKQIGTTGYGYTLNLLLKFDKKTEDKLADIEKIYGADSQQYLDALNGFAEKITVNISNPNYDPKAKCVSEDKQKQEQVDRYGYHDCGEANCPLKPFGIDVGTKYDEILTAEEKANIKVGYGVDKDGNAKITATTVLKMINYDLGKIKNDTTITDEFARQVKLIEEFTKWIYLVNDDPGMFSDENKKGYLVSKTGDSDYATEYTEQSRLLMGADKATIKDATSYAHPTFDSAKEHYVGRYSVADIDSKTATKVSDFSSMIAVTKFGIHVIMISSMPGYYQTDGELIEDAIFSYDREEYVTNKKAISDAIKNNVEQDIYAKNPAVKDLIDNYDTYVKVDKNIYKGLVEELSK